MKAEYRFVWKTFCPPCSDRHGNRYYSNWKSLEFELLPQPSRIPIPLRLLSDDKVTGLFCQEEDTEEFSGKEGSRNICEEFLLAVENENRAEGPLEFSCFPLHENDTRREWSPEGEQTKEDEQSQTHTHTHTEMYLYSCTGKYVNVYDVRCQFCQNFISNYLLLNPNDFSIFFPEQLLQDST